jgi:hypothetical protein
MPRRSFVPSYRLHKQSGQAVITLTDEHGSRRDVLLGKHGTPESRAEYLRTLAEWEASDRNLPSSPQHAASDITLNELMERYWRFAESYYVKDEKPSGEQEPIRQALRPVKRLYGHTLANDFGPLAL